MRKEILKIVLPALGVTSALFADDDWSLNHHINIFADYVYMNRALIHEKTIVRGPLVAVPPPPPIPCNPCSKCCEKPCVPYAQNKKILTTEKVVHKFDYESGYRVGLTVMPNPASSFELVFLKVDEWEAKKTVESRCGATIRYPFCDPFFAHDFVNADKAEAEYTSRFKTGEVNYWRIFTPRRVDYFSVACLVGARAFQVNEKFELEFTRGPNESNYDVKTKNRLVGGQLGVDLQVNPTRLWSWDFVFKGGVFYNRSRQETFLGDFNNTVNLIHGKEHRHSGAYMGAGSVTLVCQFAKHLNIHIGYEGIYLYGLALAAEQLSKKTSGCCDDHCPERNLCDKHCGEHDCDNECEPQCHVGECGVISCDDENTCTEVSLRHHGQIVVSGGFVGLTLGF